MLDLQWPLFVNNIKLYWNPVLLSSEVDGRTRRADYLSQAFKRLLVNNWHLVSSNLTGCNRYGPKIWGGCAPLGEVELGPHLTQCGQGWGLPARLDSSWSIKPFGHNTPTSQTDRTERQTDNGRPLPEQRSTVLQLSIFLRKVFKPPNVHRLFGNIFINRVAPYWWLSLKKMKMALLFCCLQTCKNTSHWRHHWQRIYNVYQYHDGTVVDCWKLLFQQSVKIWCQKSTTCMEKYVMYGDKTRALSFTR